MSITELWRIKGNKETRICLKCSQYWIYTPIESHCGKNLLKVPAEVLCMWYGSYRDSMDLAEFVKKLGYSNQ